jgi:Putative zinc-finger
VTEDHVSDLRWDRWLAGELPAGARAEIDAHTAACAACATRLRELTAEAQAFTLRPRTFALAAPPKRSWWLGPGIAGALAVAASIVVLVVRSPRDPEELGGRPKGGAAHLLLEAGQPGRLAPIAEGDTVHPGDYVQAGYSAERAGFGAVLSLDGAGTASAYVPARGAVMVELPAGGERGFPTSTVLDAVTGRERIVILWCDAPHPLGPLLGELRAAGRLATPAGCVARTVELAKQ